MREGSMLLRVNKAPLLRKMRESERKGTGRDPHVRSGNVWGVFSDMHAPVPFCGNEGVYIGAFTQRALGVVILVVLQSTLELLEMTAMRWDAETMGCSSTVIY
jgi:hypothetical protein